MAKIMKFVIFKIGHHFPLSEAAKAHELVENRLSIGKVLLDVRN